LSLPSALAEKLGAACPGRVSVRAVDLDAYARDLWPRGLLGVAEGVFAPNPPDAVVWPKSVEELVTVIRACGESGTPIVPYGAGSGVCGGAMPLRGGVTVDMKRMARLKSLDAEAGLATFEAGIVGEHLEHALNRRGLTLGHFPSSIMCSTMGGWLAARSAGQLSTRYGKIEDLARSTEFVDGVGRVHRFSSGDAPELMQLVIGSEGTLGFFTEATLAVSPMPAARHYRGWAFPRVAAGCEAIRRLLQRGLRPACLRLYDELDSFLHRLGGKGHEIDIASLPLAAQAGGLDIAHHKRGHGTPSWQKRLLGAALGSASLFNRLFSTALPWVQDGCLLVVGFDGTDTLAEAEAAAATIELERAGGRDLGPEPGERWLAHRYAVSFRMSKAFDAGTFVDTMEVASTWERLMEVYHAVRTAVGEHAFVMAHFSHAYPDGCSIYFTFAAPAGSRSESERRYDDLWRAGMSAATRAGATLSHHHGVGLLKAALMPEEHGASMSIYRALKRVFDPMGIMNPGKMGL
jgi:alkyldihydroxyacetonephosphate synthase